jgi:hypothetical protein
MLCQSIKSYAIPNYSVNIKKPPVNFFNIVYDLKEDEHRLSESMNDTISKLAIVPCQTNEPLNINDIKISKLRDNPLLNLIEIVITHVGHGEGKFSKYNKWIIQTYEKYINPDSEPRYVSIKKTNVYLPHGEGPEEIKCPYAITYRLTY